MAETVDEPSDVASCEPISTSGFVVVKTLGKGKVFPVEDEIPDDVVLASDPAEDFRSLTMEMETRDAVDECSPRGVLEDCIRSSESEINSSKTSTSCSEANANQCVIANWQVFLRLWKHKSMRRLYAFPALSVGIGKLVRKRNRNSGGNKSSGSVLEDASLCLFKPSWSNFTLAELKVATNNFSSENIIGQGGFADVFKGCLQDGSHVAIKRLKKGTTEQMISDFLSELGIIVHIDHPNAAKLIGIGIEGGMHLVLQLSPHGSLATMLHGPKEKLTWSVRYKIALGSAEGLQYLHEGCQRRIIHRDIKAANILLTEDFEPQICDFGLAKWLPDQLTHHTVSHFEGTFGYLAPEYFTHGIVDEKIDVYAYGVLLLELISGREALDSSQQSLVMWAKPFLDKHEAKELVDPSLGDAYDSQKLNRVALAASMCVQQSSILRPQMCQVVELLKAEGSLESAKLCRKATLKRTYSEELLDADEYNSTKNLDDLNRHRELALEL